jgi:hypothetical protein
LSASKGGKDESLVVLLKGLMASDTKRLSVVEKLIQQYSDHIAHYVTMKKGVYKYKFGRARPLIRTVGTEVCGHILSFLDERSRARSSVVCKTFKDWSLKLLWKSVCVSVDWDDSQDRECLRVCTYFGTKLKVNSSAWHFIENLSLDLKLHQGRT